MYKYNILYVRLKKEQKCQCCKSPASLMKYDTLKYKSIDGKIVNLAKLEELIQTVLIYCQIWLS